MSNPITVSDEAVEAALTVWSAAAWDNIRRTLAKEGGTLPDPAAAMRAALEAAAPFMCEAQAKLSAFVRYVLAEGSWAGYGIDGGDVQDAAERFGLIVSEPYDPAKHGYDVDFDDGDRWLTFTPLVLPLSSIGEV
jgi:hypothetical protein